MIVDPKTERVVFHECPECKSPVRGLINSHCIECEQMQRTREQMWADMDKGNFSFSDIT